MDYYPAEQRLTNTARQNYKMNITDISWSMTCFLSKGKIWETKLTFLQPKI